MELWFEWPTGKDIFKVLLRYVNTDIMRLFNIINIFEWYDFPREFLFVTVVDGDIGVEAQFIKEHFLGYFLGLTGYLWIK